MITYLIIHRPSQIKDAWVTEHWYLKLPGDEIYPSQQFSLVPNLLTLTDLLIKPVVVNGNEYSFFPNPHLNRGWGIEDLLLGSVQEIWCLFFDAENELDHAFCYGREYHQVKPEDLQL